MKLELEAVVTGNKLDRATGLWQTEISFRVPDGTSYPQYVQLTINKDLPRDSKLLLVLTDEADYDKNDVISYKPEVK